MVGGFDDSAQSQQYAPVTIVQATENAPQEPFFAEGNVAAKQGYIGSGATRRTTVA